MENIIEKAIKVLDEVIEKLPLDENKSRLIDLVIDLRLSKNEDEYHTFIHQNLIN